MKRGSIEKLPLFFEKKSCYNKEQWCTSMRKNKFLILSPELIIIYGFELILGFGEN